MSATLDFDTDVGKVRGIIGDTDITTPWLQDEHITSNLTIAGDVLELGAALCLEAMAVRVGMTNGKVKILDLEVDGPALSSVLLRMAESLRKNYKDTILNDPDFEVAQLLINDFSLRNFYFNEYLQEEGE